MSIDRNVVDKIANLARLGLDEDEKLSLTDDLNGILNWFEHLAAVDTKNIEAMTSIHAAGINEQVLRQDEVLPTPGGDYILSNAPSRKLDFFTVPKVVE